MTTGLLITIGGFLFIIITGAIYARSGMWKAFKNQDKFIAMQQSEIKRLTRKRDEKGRYTK